jgi:hypothetical protein
MQLTQRALLLLALIASMQLLQVAEAISKKDKREKAIKALKQPVPKKGSGGMKDGRPKSEVLKETINAINSKARE